MRKKRITAFLCAAVIAAAGLAGCGGTKAPAEVQTADVTEGENGSNSRGGCGQCNRNHAHHLGAGSRL